MACFELLKSREKNLEVELKKTLYILIYFTCIKVNSQVKEVNYLLVDSVINSDLSMPYLNNISIDSGCIVEIKENSSNVNEIIYKRNSDNSFILILKYSDYHRYIYKFSDSAEFDSNDSLCTKVSKGKVYFTDSTLEYTFYNIIIVLDKNTRGLLEFNRFKTPSDSTDYNSFVIDRTVDNGSGYDFIFPIQWHLNGRLKSDVKFENNYIYVTNYNSEGNLVSLIIYLQYYDEIGLDVKLVKSIYF